MDVEEVKMEKAPKGEKGKGDYKEDKNWENTVEKNTETVGEQGSETKGKKKAASAPDVIIYRGKRYAKVNQ